MTEQSPNDQFHASSFMQGHNAEYLEQICAQYTNDPAPVDAARAGDKIEAMRAAGDSPAGLGEAVLKAIG